MYRTRVHPVSVLVHVHVCVHMHALRVPNLRRSDLHAPVPRFDMYRLNTTYVRTYSYVTVAVAVGGLLSYRRYAVFSY